MSRYGRVLGMASKHEPRRSRRDELSPVLGEGLDAWAKRVRIQAVINPLELAEERGRQEKARKRIVSRLRRRVRRATTWLIGSLLALAASVTLHQVASLSWWLVVASAVAVVISVGAAARAGQLLRSGAAARITPRLVLGQDEIVRLAELDGTDRALLQRARQAINHMLSYMDSPDSVPDPVGLEVELREQEWRVAVWLRGATRLSVRCDADPAAMAGSQARRDLEDARVQITAWVCALEELAADSMARDNGQQMNSVSQVDDAGLDLAASVEIDAQRAIERIREIRHIQGMRRFPEEDGTGENG